MKLSILDQSPIIAGHDAAQAIEATVRLARRADALGYHRYWLAEHHAIGKGQTLLDLGRAEDALACFDEALRLDPRHPEAFLKKGAALELARKPDEAIACYDRAIATDQSFTLAYLQKGGLCNRLERYEEALRCYEEALKTQARRDQTG